MTLAADLILLVEGQVLQAVDDPQFVLRVERIELFPLVLLFLRHFDMLTRWAVTPLAANFVLARPLHLPLPRLCWIGVGCGGKFKSCRVTAHAFGFAKPGDRQFKLGSRRGATRAVAPDPILRLEIHDFPPAAGLPRLWFGIHGPAERRGKEIVRRVAILILRTDMISLLPLTADDFRHFVFYSFRLNRTFGVHNDEVKFVALFDGPHFETDGSVLQ